ncbi:hypothetical protein HO663_05925 [Streptococcus suis]|uniref:Immunity MXAN-0049 protein domain-containing protein n=1 Tax=Streptococcus suis TaxID=1307 RepID=A0A0Z8EIC9_STRSU|nr:DUF1629 domain-containing protein [Streptococcus suis]MCK3907850.1 hypothetical protein [Streptococcus suis]MDW8645575.1 hypothetical protein [Streptococcus suis]NQH27625.1 hypothetical protein [Streptococcus suis]NQH47692.1 hypothetical protein [Streptococcus suis]NQN32478.1 hypothetical protein [Streptococcus suis]
MIYKFGRNANFLDTTSVVILDDSNIKEVCYLDYKKGWFKLAFKAGKMLELSLIPELIFYYNSSAGGEFYETIINAFGLLTIRSDVMEAFIENGVTGLQYIPIIIEDKETGYRNTDYYIVNFLIQLDAVNLEFSKYNYNAKYNMYSFWGNRISFNSHIIDGIDIFIDKKASMSVFVSEKIRQIFIKKKWHTMIFNELNIV